MIALDENAIYAAAPDADSAKNGRDLVLKNKFGKLCIAEEVVLFGECQGSGKTPYQCSVDFARPEQPTYRCSCPSRKFPCKHCLGLLFAYVQKKPFTVADVPPDLAAKREKLATRTEKKTEEAAKPKKVNKAALAKKIEAQLAGIDTLEKLTHDAVRLGIGNMNAKLARTMEEQAKLLGDAYLPGAQAALVRYTQLFSDETGQFANRTASQHDAIQTEALEQLTRLHAIIKQGRTYLKARLADENLAVPTDTAIAAWLGHAWQLTELKAAGLAEENVELVQLAFHSQDDEARKEYVDTGIWMKLDHGKIYLTQTFRPYKAAKFIKADDSYFGVARVPMLYIYPGGVNPRVRWESQTSRATTPADFARIRSHAANDFTSLAKQVKANLKGALSDRTPIFALSYAKIGVVNHQTVVEDAQGQRLVLANHGIHEEPPSCHLLRYLPNALLANQTMIVRFRHDLDLGTLTIKPLTIVSSSAIVRLTL